MPKYTVREGFVVNVVERVKQTVSGQEQTVEREYNYYPGDPAFELEEQHVRAHAHKLEPAPKDAKAAEFLESLHSDTSASTVSAEGSGVDTAAIAAASAKATVEALVAAGVIKPQAAS